MKENQNHPNHDTSEHGTETAQPETAPVQTPEGNGGYVIEEEYEQFKRKNRRRMVGAGALVLIAGSLFTAASNNQPPTGPTLAPENRQAAAPAVTTDILHPGNGRASAPVINVDDSQNAPIKISRKIQAAAPLSPEEKAALEARQQRAKAQRLAQQRKQEAERVERESKNALKTTDTANVKDKEKDRDSIKPQNTADRAKEREEEQRRKKAQALSAKAEAERTAKEKAAADKAREAQLAADKKRANERAKLESQKKTQTNNDKLAADKQREKNRSSDKTTAAKTEKKPQNTADNTAGRRVTVQAGAFADKAHAQKVQQQLKSLNYSSHLEEVQTAKGTVYRVKTGKFANQTEAKNAIERIKGKGMNGVVVIGQ